MASAKISDLKVRPLQSADLCFEIDGVLGEQNAQMPMLGLSVARFDFAAFYANLGVELNPADPGRLKYDSQTIHDDAAVKTSLLFALRAELAKAALDKAIAARENSYYQKYKNQAAIIKQMQFIYDPANPGSKPSRLAALMNISQTQHDSISAAYIADGRTSVIKTTNSDLSSTTNSTGTSDTSSQGTSDSTSTNSSNQASQSAADTKGQGGPTTTSSHTDGTSNVKITGTGNDNQTSKNTAHATNAGTAIQTQSSKNTDYAYRHPSLENDAQYQRAQVSLLDEQFSQFMSGQSLPVLDRVFNNELRAIDLDVKRLQVAYLSTILMSPIDGIVTGLFKNLGDRTKAGEPVMRVENYAEVFLTGTLIYRGLLTIGSKVSVTTSVFDSVNKITIAGAVVSVRGHNAEDDEWNVLIRCGNQDAAGNFLLPVNYNFGCDDTQVDVT